MTTFYDLRSILSDQDAVAALVRYFERGWDRALSLVALGIARPGARQTRELLAKLVLILRSLDPSRTSFVRHWVRQWIRDAFLAGETASVKEIQGSPKKALGQDALDSVTNAVAALDQKLSLVVSGMNAALVGAVLATHRAILSDALLQGAVTGGILRTPLGLAVAVDLQKVITEGTDAMTAAKLRRSGIPTPVVRSLDALNRGVITVGKASVNLETYVRQSAQDALGEVAGSAAMAVSRRNEVDHVFIDKEASKGTCPYCGQVEFNVFYVGSEAKDPAGFPRLRDLPGGGPKWHPNCVHERKPWEISQKSAAEIAEALASSLAIPAEYYGEGAVERVNSGVGAEGHIHDLRKHA